MVVKGKEHQTLSSTSEAFSVVKRRVHKKTRGRQCITVDEGSGKTLQCLVYNLSVSISPLMFNV